MWVLQDDGELSTELKTYAKRLIKYLNTNFDGVENEDDADSYFSDGLHSWIDDNVSVDVFVNKVGFETVLEWFKESDLAQDFFSYNNDHCDGETFIYVALEQALYFRVKWVER